MTLRGTILVAGVLLLAVGVAGALAGAGPGMVGLIVGALVVLAGTVFERRYHGHTQRPGPGWERTSERFREPDGAVVDVWYHPPSGERRYIRR